MNFFDKSASCYPTDISFEEDDMASSEGQTLLDEKKSLPVQEILKILDLKKNAIEKKWRDYLNDIPNLFENKLDIEFVNLVKNVRKQLHDFIGYQFPPDAVEGEDGGLQLNWEQGNLYLAVDIISSDNLEWFLKDIHTRKSWGEEGITLSDFPTMELREKLKTWKQS